MRSPDKLSGARLGLFFGTPVEVAVARDWSRVFRTTVAGEPWRDAMGTVRVPVKGLSSPPPAAAVRRLVGRELGLYLLRKGRS